MNRLLADLPKLAAANPSFCAALVFWLAILSQPSLTAEAPDEELKPIDVAKIDRTTDVDFEKEILPLLRKKCLACHSASEAASDLVLENPESIRKGGAEGPAVVPKEAAESLLLLLATHRKEPVMPPPDNDVGAGPLTPQELGLIKLWEKKRRSI